MGSKPRFIVDTDILIKVYRGHEEYRLILDDAKGRIAVSAVSYLELLFGLRTRQRIIDLHKQLRSYQIIHLSENISQKAIELVSKYGPSNTIRPADSLIAATALAFDLKLFTDNKQDFNFVEGIRFYN